MLGTVLLVDVVPDRAFLSEDAASGATTLLLDDATAVQAATSVTVSGLSVDVLEVEITEGDAPDVLTLASPLPAAVDAGQPVSPLPGTSQTYAEVLVEGTNDVIRASIGQDLQAASALAPGPREDGEGEIVTLDDRGDDVVIVDVDGRLVLDGAAIDPETLPDTATSDGAAPAASPVPEVVDGIGVVFVRLPKVGNPSGLVGDDVTVEVYASRTSGAPADADTLVGVVPDGGTIMVGVVQGTAVSAEEQVYVRTRALDADGAAPLSVERAGTVLEVGFEQVSESIRAAIRDADEKAVAAQTTADGKSTSFYGPVVASGNPSTSPAPVDGDLYFGRNAEGRVAQVLRRVNGAWASEQIDGQVLAHIDAGSITTGTLNVATLLEAGTLLARLAAVDEITAEMVAAEILVANEIFSQAGVTVGNITITPDGGIVIPQPSGRQIRFPSDGSPAEIGGNLHALSITILDKLTLQGLDNRVDSGSRLVVGSGITSPRREPEVATVWPSVASSLSNNDAYPSYVRGMTTRIDRDGWLVARAFLKGELVILGLDGEADFPVGDLGWTNFLPEGGVTRIGSSYYVLGVGINGGSRDGKWFVKRLDSSFTQTAEWEWVPSSSRTHRPAIGTNGTDVVIAWRNASNTAVRTYNAATGAQLSPFISVAHGGAAGHCTSVTWGGADLDGRVVVTFQSSMLAFSTSNARDAAYEWPLAGSASLVGMAWNGSAFRHLDAQGRLWTYSALKSSTTRTIAYSWYDSDTSGGVHETDAGPSTTFVQPARSFIRVQTDTPYDTGLPNDPDSVRVWFGANLQPDLAPGQTSVTYGVPLANGGTKAQSFANAGSSAAYIASEAEAGWRGSGDGAFQVRDPILPTEPVTKSMYDATRPRAGQYTQPTNTSGTSQRVNFTTPFPPGVVPEVFIAVVGGGPIAAAWTMNATDVDRTGFTSNVWRASGSHSASVLRYYALPPY